jgi:hypothetical protein
MNNGLKRLKIGLKLKGKKMTAEQKMKEGFESFFKAKEAFKCAIKLYREMSGDVNRYNSENTQKAVGKMNDAYELIADIWTEDLQ